MCMFHFFVFFCSQFDGFTPCSQLCKGMQQPVIVGPFSRAVSMTCRAKQGIESFGSRKSLKVCDPQMPKDQQVWHLCVQRAENGNNMSM